MQMSCSALGAHARKPIPCVIASVIQDTRYSGHRSIDALPGRFGPYLGGGSETYHRP